MDEENPVLCGDYLRVWASTPDDMAETYFNELIGTLQWMPSTGLILNNMPIQCMLDRCVLRTLFFCRNCRTVVQRLARVVST